MEITQETLIALVTYWGLKIIAAVAILLVGRWLAGWVTRLMSQSLEKRKVEPTLVRFLSRVLYFALIIAVVISAIAQVGVKTTSFVAILGAAGLAVGLALQGSLSNFAAGTLLMLFRPFRIGDYVEVAGTSGTVQEIGVLMTILRSPESKKIFVPNSQIMSDTITNVAAYPTRRIDFEIGISHDDDPERAKAVIRDVLNGHPKVLADPAPTVEVWSLGDSQVNFIVRPWTLKEDWFATRCELLPAITQRLKSEGLTIPYPQRDVHLYQDSSTAR